MPDFCSRVQLEILSFSIQIICWVPMLGTVDFAGSEHWAPFNLISIEHIIMHPCENLFLIQTIQGFWYFAEKKAKFCGIFRGKFTEKSADFAGFSREKKSKFTEKSADFAGFSREKSQNSQKNRPISRDFSGKSQISKDFRGKFLEKSADFTGNFGGKLRQETISKNSWFRRIFFGKFC